MADEIIRILSIDGGGIRGIIPARLLQRIEESIGEAASTLFHLIAGTSTGGILGFGLAKGKSLAR
jgi:patatin-like phospholipase/acyl hydrolase